MKSGVSVHQWLVSIYKEDANTVAARGTRGCSSPLTPLRRIPSAEDDLALGVDASLFDKPAVRTVQEFLRSTADSPHLSRWNSVTSVLSSQSSPPSVMELLNLWEDDPEELLLELGFGYEEPDLTGRIPARFINYPSKARGINIQIFLEAQKNRMDIENPDVRNRFRQLEVLQEVTTAFSSLLGAEAGQGSSGPVISPENRERRRKMGMLFRKASKKSLKQARQEQHHPLSSMPEDAPLPPELPATFHPDRRSAMKRARSSLADNGSLTPLVEMQDLEASPAAPLTGPQVKSSILPRGSILPSRKRSPGEPLESFEMEEVLSFDEGSLAGSYTGAADCPGTSERTGIPRVESGVVRTNSCQSDSSGFLEEPFVPALSQLDQPPAELIKMLNAMSRDSTESRRGSMEQIPLDLLQCQTGEDTETASPTMDTNVDTGQSVLQEPLDTDRQSVFTDTPPGVSHPQPHSIARSGSGTQAHLMHNESKLSRDGPQVTEGLKDKQYLGRRERPEDTGTVSPTMDAKADTVESVLQETIDSPQRRYVRTDIPSDISKMQPRSIAGSGSETRALFMDTESNLSVMAEGTHIVEEGKDLHYLLVCERAEDIETTSTSTSTSTDTKESVVEIVQSVPQDNLDIEAQYVCMDIPPDVSNIARWDSGSGTLIMDTKSEFSEDTEGSQIVEEVRDIHMPQENSLKTRGDQVPPDLLSDGAMKEVVSHPPDLANVKLSRPSREGLGSGHSITVQMPSAVVYISQTAVHKSETHGPSLKPQSTPKQKRRSYFRKAWSDADLTAWPDTPTTFDFAPMMAPVVPEKHPLPPSLPPLGCSPKNSQGSRSFLVQSVTLDTGQSYDDDDNRWEVALLAGSTCDCCVQHHHHSASQPQCHAAQQPAPPYSMDELEDMMAAMRKFRSVLAEIEDRLSNEQASVYNALPDSYREEVEDLQKLRAAVKQEADTLEQQLTDLVHHYDGSIKMKMNRLLDEQSNLCSQLRIRPFEGLRPTPVSTKSVAIQCSLLPVIDMLEPHLSQQPTNEVERRSPVSRRRSRSNHHANSNSKQDKLDFVSFIKSLKNSLELSISNDSFE